ncbi:hypothetical protein Baya_16154 [Bagarius yarrelli]|uniref:Uncharacterized protein n=1 Tax=Bagarius yarrelli TaxID=175774 RepID=A0A556VUJ7_BAGYA|nr:hypothetical protein Baya_16154 [Bagarius yarrelli]
MNTRKVLERRWSRWQDGRPGLLRPGPWGTKSLWYPCGSEKQCRAAYGPDQCPELTRRLVLLRCRRYYAPITAAEDARGTRFPLSIQLRIRKRAGVCAAGTFGGTHLSVLLRTPPNDTRALNVKWSPPVKFRRGVLSLSLSMRRVEGGMAARLLHILAYALG